MDCKSSSSSLYTNLYESRNNTKNNHRNSHSHKSLEYYHPCSIENAEESHIEEIQPVKLHRTHIIRANQAMNNIKHKEAIENIIQSYKKYGLLVQTIATSYLKGLEEYWQKQYTQYQENMEKESINSDYSIQEYDQKLPTTNLSTSHITPDKKIVLFTLRSQWGVIFNGDHDLHVLCAYNQDSFTCNCPVLTSSHLNHKLEKKLKESDKEEPKLGGINFIKELINKYVLKRFIVQDLENNLHQVSLKHNQLELHENFLKPKEYSLKLCLNKQIADLKDVNFIKNKSKPKNNDIIHNEVLIAPPEASVKSISAMFFFIKGTIGTQSYHHEMLSMGLDEQEEAIKFATTYQNYLFDFH